MCSATLANSVWLTANTAEPQWLQRLPIAWQCQRPLIEVGTKLLSCSRGSSTRTRSESRGGGGGGGGGGGLTAGCMVLIESTREVTCREILCAACNVVCRCVSTHYRAHSQAGAAAHTGRPAVRNQGLVCVSSWRPVLVAHLFCGVRWSRDTTVPRSEKSAERDRRPHRHAWPMYARTQPPVSAAPPFMAPCGKLLIRKQQSRHCAQREAAAKAKRTKCRRTCAGQYTCNQHSGAHPLHHPGSPHRWWSLHALVFKSWCTCQWEKKPVRDRKASWLVLCSTLLYLPSLL